MCLPLSLAKNKEREGVGGRGARVTRLKLISQPRAANDFWLTVNKVCTHVYTRKKCVRILDLTEKKNPVATLKLEKFDLFSVVLSEDNINEIIIKKYT